jgi:hypothetical protein
MAASQIGHQLKQVILNHVADGSCFLVEAAATGYPKLLGHRYSGALVADFHRCLLEGGRVLYECASLAFVVDQAGEHGREAEVEAHSIHQRSLLAIGSSSDVALYVTISRQRPSLPAVSVNAISLHNRSAFGARL